MDVFVIPVGRDRYELYCEPSPDHEGDAETAAPRGLLGMLEHRFGVLLRSAEQPGVGSQPGGPATQVGFSQAVRIRILAWVAQRIAEQRLLWKLRRQTSAVAVHPQDVNFDQALVIVRHMLQREYERHRRWMIVDGLAFLVTGVALGPFFLLVPGVANLPAAYFGFRAFGHWWSMLGARQGLQRVVWSGRPCPPLTELRDVVTLAAPARAARVRDIAARLRLPHLSTFVESVVVRHA